jgi:hypothetical protein
MAQGMGILNKSAPEADLQTEETLPTGPKQWPPQERHFQVCWTQFAHLDPNNNNIEIYFRRNT